MTPPDLAPEHAAWRAEIAAVRASRLPWMLLRAASLAFLEGPRASAAARHGWTDRDLFGVFAGETARIAACHGSWGAVSRAALATYPPCRLLEIGADHAVFLAIDGARHSERRGPADPSAVAWWRHPDLEHGP